MSNLIQYLSVYSSAIYASAYIVRALIGRDMIACDRMTSLHLVHRSVRNISCSVIAAVLYYCGFAGATWWAVLTISWYLAAARKVCY